ncbi:hypothetical protein BRPE64_ECDS00660 (plasmid) [Caballeronia insecticola]|uniref:Uncharacterized protein n=1 Tax=Caballeronia insecticola TaxID=758793 RepID=R4WUJ0_9BURK|nr:hypothetical protein BRPE64_ECDS00660 [Caballeronia insecticola]
MDVVDNNKNTTILQVITDLRSDDPWHMARHCFDPAVLASTTVSAITWELICHR